MSFVSNNLPVNRGTCLRIWTGYFQQQWLFWFCSEIKCLILSYWKRIGVLVSHMTSLEIVRIRDICVNKRKQPSEISYSWNTVSKNHQKQKNKKQSGYTILSVRQFLLPISWKCFVRNEPHASSRGLGGGVVFAVECNWLKSAAGFFKFQGKHNRNLNIYTWHMSLRDWLLKLILPPNLFRNTALLLLQIRKKELLSKLNRKNHYLKGAKNHLTSSELEILHPL